MNPAPIPPEPLSTQGNELKLAVIIALAYVPAVALIALAILHEYGVI